MRYRIAGILAVVLISLASVAVPSASYAQNQEEHCVLRGDDELRRIRCYPTFAEAISVATGGRVQLDPNMPPNEITQEMLDRDDRQIRQRIQLSAQQDTVIGIFWAGREERGASLVYTLDGGCRDHPEIQLDVVPGDWNDRISSSHAYGGCRTVRHYEHSQFRGALRDCTPACGRLGVLNNQTSSIKWFR